MAYTEATLRASRDRLIETARMDANDDTLILAWDMKLKDESQPRCVEVAAAANEEVPVEE